MFAIEQDSLAGARYEKQALTELGNRGVRFSESGTVLGLGWSWRAARNLKFVHDVLNLGDFLRQFFSFLTLLITLHGTFQRQSSVVSRVLNAVVLQSAVRRQGRFEMVLDGAVELGILLRRLLFTLQSSVVHLDAVND